MTWVSLALTLLKLINVIMTWARERQLINEGYDLAIAEAAQEVLAKTTRGKALLEKINAMDESTVDSELRKLEPPAG